MAIGDVQASGGLQAQLISGNAGGIRQQAASGLGDAVNRLAQAGMGYLNSRTDIEAIYDRRAKASAGLELDTKFLQYQEERAQEYTEFSRSRSASPAGMTRDYDATLAERETEFLKTVPEYFQEEMKAKLTQDRARRVGSAFTAELGLLDQADTTTLNTGLNTLGSSLKAGRISLEDAEAQYEELLSKTTLDEATKVQFLENGKATLQGLEFGTLVETAASGYGAVGDGASGDDVVAAGLIPQERAILNAISARESSGYNIWNGGSTFDGYADHPAATGKAPGESTAAGRYQFILGTWRAASSSYEKTYGVKVPNFSPEWQDRVALHWAERQFNAHRKDTTFRAVLASGDPKQLLLLRDVLGKPRSANPHDLEWEGLGHMSDADFIEAMTGMRGIAGGGTGPAEMPNAWTDPRFSNLSLEAKSNFATAASSAAENQKQSAATQMRLERDSFLDSVYNAGYENQPGVLEALQKSGQWDAEAQARYNSGQEVFRKSESDVATIGNALTSGTPLAASDAKAFGNWFGREGFAGLTSGDPASYQKLGWAVGQAKMFPEGSKDAFTAAISNPSTASQALGFLASAMKGDPTILGRSGFSADTMAQVQLYKNLAEREATPEKAFERYAAVTDTSQRMGKTPAALGKEAAEIFTQTYATADDLVDIWDGIFTLRPDSLTNPATEGQLMQDASTAYQDGYKIYGTPEAAEAYMQSYLGKIWGVSQAGRPDTFFGFGGEEGAAPERPTVLMRHPPENYYSSDNGDHGYLYQAVTDFAKAAGVGQNDVTLIPDDTTDAEVRSGKLPTYKVLGKGEFGEAVLLPGRFGGEPLAQTIHDGLSADTAAVASLSYVNEFSVQADELRALIETERGYSRQQETFNGTAPDNTVVAGLEQELANVVQKQKAAVVAALENGHIAPELAAENADVNELATSLQSSLEQRLASEGALSRRFTQATVGKSPEAGQKILTDLVGKELRVPQVLAAIILRNMQGAK